MVRTLLLSVCLWSEPRLLTFSDQKILGRIPRYSLKAHPGLLRMVSFSKEHDRNVFSCPFYCVKWWPQNLVITAPARIGFTVFNRVCSIGHPGKNEGINLAAWGVKLIWG